MDTKKLRQKILDLAIHGKLVPQDPNDEPASVLLERIRAEKEKLIKEGKIKAPKKSKSTGDTSHYPKDVPFEVPEGWALSTVIDVFQINPKNHADDATKAGFVPMTNISDGFEDRFSFEIKPWNSIKTGFTHFQNGDIAVAKISPCLENRKSFVVRGLPQEIGAGTTELFIFRSRQLVPEYCLLFFKSEFFISNCVGTFNGVVGQQRVARSVIEELPFPIPPVAEQEKIVQRVRAIFRMISEVENSQAAISIGIEKSKARILDLAIHGKLVPQNPSDEPAIELLKRINPAFQPSHNLHYHDNLPKGWYPMTFGEAAEYINGRAFKPEEWEKDGLPIVRIQNLNDSFSEYNYSTGAFEGRYLIHHGDLLFAWAASLDAYIWSGEDAWLNQHIFRVIPKNCVLPKYLYYTLKAKIHDFYQRSHGSGMVHITRNTFLKEAFLLPPLNEQKRIIAAIEELYTTIDSLTACFTK